MTVTGDQLEESVTDRVALHYDSRPMKLCGWAAPEAADLAADELILSLMAGDVLLGTLRREISRPDVDEHLGYAGPPPGFSIADFGLAAFARMTGLRDLAIAAAGEHVSSSRRALPPVENGDISYDPLGSRGGALKTLKLTDLWLESNRDLSLRFDGSEHSVQAVDAYQCTPGGEPMLINLAADQAIGGMLSIARVTLLNPFLPLLLIFKGDDGSIDAIDVIPFPSLARGGQHEAERLILGDGGDDLGDTASVSAALLPELLASGERQAGGIATVMLDPAVHTGLEPGLNDDLLGWISGFLGVSVQPSRRDGGNAPAFIADRLARHAPAIERTGHTLHLPADCIPSISALVHGLPTGLAAQTVTGGMAVAEWNRHGRIWSVWQPPLGRWLDGLQAGASRQFVPTIEIRSEEGHGTDRALSLEWPLALALRDRPARISHQAPFELSADLPLPLLCNGALPAGAGLSALILCDRADMSVFALLESLARQESVGVIDVVVSRPTAKPDPKLSEALASLFPDRHRIVPQPASMGRLDRIKAVRETLEYEQVLIVDAGTILPDPRTLATLLPMLDVPDVATVGCLVRTAHGKAVSLSAGYAPTSIDLRGVPALSFSTIDSTAFRQPATYCVVANTTAALVTTKETLRDLDAHGSSALRPEVDDLLLGIQLIEGCKLNVCTTLVSVYSEKTPVNATGLGVSVPFRLSPDVFARIMASATIVQTLR
ncbi:MAG: hypothetical protein ACR2FK_07285 [Sphingomicrobium sp.]